MIFDSTQMIALREKYRDTPNYDVPEIVFLDRFEGYDGERQLLEYLFNKISTDKQKDWLGRLISEDPGQHIGVWFEIMLFGWLHERYAVQVEPQILGNYPDFTLEIVDQILAIEARALLLTPAERERRRKFNRILSTLGSIEKPYALVLKVNKVGEGINVVRFSTEVIQWLNTAADQEFNYQDDSGNDIHLSAKPMPNLKKIGVISTEGIRISADELKAPLSHKARQHRALRKAGYPYIVSIFLEPSHLSAEEVVEAWLGKVSVVYDSETNQVVEEKFDQTGIHYFGQEIRHKSVTGTLVFRPEYDKDKKTRYLRSWYVQNPYANIIIDPATFPTESRFVVVGQDDKIFEMKWAK